MLSVYPACFLKEESGYTVIFPDLNGTATCGATQAEAVRYAIDCMAGYLHDLKNDGIAFPEPSEIQNVNPVKIAEELEVPAENAFVTMISVDVEEYAKKYFEDFVETKLSIPAWLNTAALKKGIDLSETLSSALLEKVNLAEAGI